MTQAVSIAQSGSNNTTFRNRIINGAMTIAQRGTSGISSATTYVCDRFLCYASGGTGAYTATQSSDAPIGFTNSLLATVTTAGTQGEAGFIQYIEGYNFADTGWGTASAKTVTISFWVKSSLTGTFAYVLRTTSGSYSYVTSYTISAANTWEKKSITIPGNTLATLNTTNGYALIAEVSLGGSGFSTSTQNTWLASNTYNLTGSVNVLATLGATFAITGVQLEIGTYATPFEQRLYGTELALCQRYYQAAQPSGTAINIHAGSYNGTLYLGQVYYKQQMRAAPTVSITSGSGYTFGLTDANTFYFTGGTSTYINQWTASAEF